jgi:hypothetical protein
MQKRYCGTGEQARLECQDWSEEVQTGQTQTEQARMEEGTKHERIDTAIARSFENIRAISGEMEEKLSAIESCPEPCGDGTVNILLSSSGQTKKLPCPLLALDCHYGKQMERELDRYITGVMTDIGVPLRHLENFPKRREAEEASRWPVRGFFIFTGGSGSGKSFEAALVLYRYLKSRVSNPFDRGSREAVEKTKSSVVWCTAMDIADDREIAAQAKRARLAVIDDLGSENDTPEGQAALRGVFLRRYDMELPTVVTTMLTMVDIELCYGSRIANRLTEDIRNEGRIIEWHGFFNPVLFFCAADGRRKT